MLPLSIEVGRDAEHATGTLVVRSRAGAATRTSTIDYSLVDSPEYHEILAVEEDVRALGPAPFTVKEDEHRPPVELAGPDALWDYVDTRGRKGLGIQRFKGLGEMNADELRDTTMDKDRRTLLRVRLEDAVAADRMFTVLMGEQVEPRRRFIETHALDVAELDV